MADAVRHVFVTVTLSFLSTKLNALEVTDLIVSGIESDLQAIRNGGMTAADAFGEGATEPYSVARVGCI